MKYNHGDINIYYKMASKIYYDRKDPGLLITSNIEKFHANMALGIFPKTSHEEISVEEISQYKIKDIAFDEIDNNYFQCIKEEISKYKFEAIAFHETTIDLLDIVFDVEHLIIGDKSKINLSSRNFKNLREITFLSVKTFKGSIVEKFEDVNKLILWYENKKSNEILEKFPNLKEFWINNGSIVELDVTHNSFLEILELHRCLKLERVIIPPTVHLNKVIVVACNKLDTSNLPI